MVKIINQTLLCKIQKSLVIIAYRVLENKMLERDHWVEKELKKPVSIWGKLTKL